MFSALGVRNYRLFFVGQGISLVGTWVRRTAMGWLVYELTGSTAKLGLVMGLALLPMFVLSPWAGSIADRVDKRRMIILTQVLATATSASIAARLISPFATIAAFSTVLLAASLVIYFRMPSDQLFVGGREGDAH
jgi:MFS family permease